MSTPSEMPLVSCIMPTTDDRRDFEALARECFDAQDYPDRELVIVRGPGKVGEKRNQACREAAGQIICHWDSDDWSAPGRISDQVARLIESGADITGYHSMRFLTEDGQEWLYKGAKNYALGTSLCFWKRHWQRHPFPALQVAEDNAFIRTGRLVAVPAGEMMLATIHGGNTSLRKLTQGANWERIK